MKTISWKYPNFPSESHNPVTQSITQWLYAWPATENITPLNKPLTNQQACPECCFSSLVIPLGIKSSELQVWIIWEVQTDVSDVAVYLPWVTWKLELANPTGKSKTPAFLSAPPKQPRWLCGAGVGAAEVRFREQFILKIPKLTASSFSSSFCPESLNLSTSTNVLCMPSPQILLFTLPPMQQCYLLTAFPSLTMEM